MKKEFFGHKSEHGREEENNLHKRAISFLYETIGQDAAGIEDFPQSLFEEISKLERYQAIISKVEELPISDIPLAVFNLISKASDTNEPSGNGVLLDSMREGNLECAGRTMIVSQVFKNIGVEHAVAAPYGHSMILFEQDEDTLVYFDANNDLYFTFPKEALSGYQGIDTMSECHLDDYTPREKDFYYGRNGVMRDMMVLPADEGILNSYLNNAVAAMNGDKEFVDDNIQVDKDASDEISKIKEALLGKNNVPDSFYEAGQERQGKDEERRQKSREEASQIFQESDRVDDFIDRILLIGELWQRLPYLKGSDDKKRIAAEWYTELKEEKK